MLQQMYEKNNIHTHTQRLASLPPPPVGVDLDRITNNSDILKRQSYRSSNYSKRRSIKSFVYSNGLNHRVTFCGQPINEDGIIIAKHDDRAFYANVAKCGSRWICPVCASKIAASYKEQLSAYIASARKAGDMLYFVTLTVQHNKVSRLNDLLIQLSESWNKLNTGRYLQKQSYYIVTEILYNDKNGWHPHYHILLNTGKSVKDTKEIEAEINKYIVEKWTKLNQGSSLSAQDVRQCNDKDVADYITKGDLSFELSAQNVKNKNTDITRGVHPLNLLGTKNEYMLKEYIEATKGKRMNRKSKGFFDAYKVSDKTETEALNENEVITETVAILSNPVYEDVHELGHLADILDHVESPETNINTLCLYISKLTGKTLFIDRYTNTIIKHDGPPRNDLKRNSAFDD